jgi:hypothetical protein
VLKRSEGVEKSALNKDVADLRAFLNGAVKSDPRLFVRTSVWGRFSHYLVVFPGVLEDSYRVLISLASRA